MKAQILKSTKGFKELDVIEVEEVRMSEENTYYYAQNNNVNAIDDNGDICLGGEKSLCDIDNSDENNWLLREEYRIVAKKSLQVDFEKLVIGVNQEQEDRGYESFSSFTSTNGIEIINPFMDEEGRFEVNPKSFYGDVYTDWKKSLIDLNENNKIKKCENGMYLVVTKYGEDDYSYLYDNSSYRSTYNEIKGELEEIGLGSSLLNDFGESKTLIAISYIKEAIRLVENREYIELSSDNSIWNDGIALFMDIDVPFENSFDEMVLEDEFSDMLKDDVLAENLKENMLKWLNSCLEIARDSDIYLAKNERY